jgi:hypothetical protein
LRLAVLLVPINEVAGLKGLLRNGFFRLLSFISTTI